jgi:two-component system, cell cycle sensor histidine kinase and response regulator CckA
MGTELAQLEARVQELEQRLVHADKLACIGQMSAGIAHEVNTPMAYVLANLTSLADLLDDLEGAPLDEAAKQALSGAREIVTDCTGGMERIRRVVSNLKVFSRVEYDHMEQVDLNRIVEAACQLAGNEVRHRARLVLDTVDVPRLLGDASKLTQVIVNLLINAAQAIESGDASNHRIVVETRLEGGEVVLRVRDTGSGIAHELLPRIFEPFVTTKPRDRGTGLGLWLVREIVRLHEGSISARSELGRGTSFEVRLPTGRSLRSLGTPEIVANQNATSIPARRRARVLLIDDDPALRRALSRLLGGHHMLIEADGGTGGIAALDSGALFDAVLCDLMMPDLDGPAVYEHLARTRPDLLAHLAFLSGGAFTPRVKRFLEEVPTQVVEKPASREVLLRVIDELMNGNAAQAIGPALPLHQPVGASK